MKLYSKDDNYILYNDNMLNLLQDIEPCSIDSIVTDPPYELGFMGKSWDRSGIAFQADTWKKCYEVLKPGGYMLVFGSPKTFHRIACAIEDAGFEIRDTIMWLYGCYSSDTQVLTNTGWKYFYELDHSEYVLQWDKDTNKLSWVKPLNYFEYDIDDDMCLFENRHISQLVTKNHKVACQVKKRRKSFSEYQLVEATDIMPSWILNFPLAGELDGSITEDDAYIIGWWLTDAWKHEDGKACMFSQSKPDTLKKLKDWFDSHGVQYSEYVKHSKNPKHKDEHIFYVTGELANKLLTNYPDREIPWSVLMWDTTSRKNLLDGLMDGDGSYRNGGYSNTFWSKKQERLDVVQALCVSLNYRAFVTDKGGVVFNTAHNSTQTQSKHHKNKVAYKGKVYCLETETGAFVVRRNGKAFISGNSGFPKSMNLGLAVDKKNGVESEIVGVKEHCKKDFKETNLYAQDPANANNTKCFGYGTEIVRKAQNEWDGWGTALKPAYEPVIVARKPCEGSCVDNVLKWGVGGINIGECRVGDDLIKGGTTPDFRDVGHKQVQVSGIDKLSFGQISNAERIPLDDHIGRFPANVILSYDDETYDEVCSGFPVSEKPNWSITKHTYTNSTGDSGIYGHYSENVSLFESYNDTGSASRYFYCAKASKRDRNEGLDAFEMGQSYMFELIDTTPLHIQDEIRRILNL